MPSPSSAAAVSPGPSPPRSGPERDHPLAGWHTGHLTSAGPSGDPHDSHLAPSAPTTSPHSGHSSTPAATLAPQAGHAPPSAPTDGCASGITMMPSLPERAAAAAGTSSDPTSRVKPDPPALTRNRRPAAARTSAASLIGADSMDWKTAL